MSCPRKVQVCNVDSLFRKWVGKASGQGFDMTWLKALQIWKAPGTAAHSTLFRVCKCLADLQVPGKSRLASKRVQTQSDGVMSREP